MRIVFGDWSLRGKLVASMATLLAVAVIVLGLYLPRAHGGQRQRDPQSGVRSTLLAYSRRMLPAVSRWAMVTPKRKRSLGSRRSRASVMPR